MRSYQLMIASFFLVGSCKKPEDLNSRKAQVTGNWTPTRTTSLYMLDGDTTSYSESPITKPCELDNYLVFSTDGRIAADDGPLKCDSTDPQSFEIGRWELSGNGSQLYFFIGNVAVLHDILKLDAQAMVLSEKAINKQSDGKTKVVTMTTYYQRP